MADLSIISHSCQIDSQTDGQPPIGKYVRFRPRRAILAAILAATFLAITSQHQISKIQLYSLLSKFLRYELDIWVMSYSTGMNRTTMLKN